MIKVFPDSMHREHSVDWLIGSIKWRYRATVNWHADTLRNKIVESQFQPDTPRHGEK